MRKLLLTAALILPFSCLWMSPCVAQQSTPTGSIVDVNKAKFFGVYRVAPHKIISISESIDGSGRLMYVDYESGQTRMLYPSSENTFFAGSGILVDTPVTLKVTFVKDGTGEVKKLRWQPSGEPDRIAAKIPFKQEQVSFQNGDVTFSGTLITPSTNGQHPVVIIVPGAFPIRRDALRVFAQNFVSRLFGTGNERPAIEPDD